MSQNWIKSIMKVLLRFNSISYIFKKVNMKILDLVTHKKSNQDQLKKIA